jgi:flagellar biogenesis protein FliO
MADEQVRKDEKALHEPSQSSSYSSSFSSSSHFDFVLVLVLVLVLDLSRFMLPMHAPRREKALQEPLSLP